MKIGGGKTFIFLAYSRSYHKTQEKTFKYMIEFLIRILIIKNKND
jgi:uncharacterized membrane protein YsdA (DUF1294 family)